MGRADDCPARDRGSSFSWRDRMIRFIAGIRSSKHLAASWSGVSGNGGEAEVGWPVGQWEQLQESPLPPWGGQVCGEEDCRRAQEK